jgi:hypothetical protein
MICVYALPLNKTTTKSFLKSFINEQQDNKKVNNPPIVLVCLFPHTISMRSGTCKPRTAKFPCDWRIIHSFPSRVS